MKKNTAIQRRLSFCLCTLSCVMWSWSTSLAQDIRWSPYKGTVYFIPKEQLGKGYGEHVYDNRILGEVSMMALNVPKTYDYDRLFPGVDREAQFGIVFKSKLKIPEEGCYQFELETDDGSRLWIDDVHVINNDKPHKMTRKLDTVALEAGSKAIKLWYYNAYPPQYGLIFNVTMLHDSVVCDPLGLPEIKSGDVLTVGDVLFQFNSHQLNDTGRVTVERICGQLAAQKVKEITIIGHADSTGTVDYNQALSLDRARTVANIIEQHMGDMNISLNTKGFGATQPIASNRTEEGRARNRRVEILVGSMQ